MQQEDGKTVLRYGHDHKRRSDYEIVDPQIIRHTQQLFARRVLPEILKVYQFHVTCMERYIVACYSAADGGHFRAHRDNTTKGTAHRRFAVSINLNEDFDGGEIRFPEYGPRHFKPPVGGAVVFSCSLLHAVSQMTAGADMPSCRSSMTRRHPNPRGQQRMFGHRTWMPTSTVDQRVEDLRTLFVPQYGRAMAPLGGAVHRVLSFESDDEARPNNPDRRAPGASPRHVRGNRCSAREGTAFGSLDA